MISTILDLLRSNNNTSAMEQVRQWLRAEPDDADAHHLLAIAAQRCGDMATANEAIERAMELQPERADFLVTRAGLALSGRDLDTAIKGMNAAIKLDPNQLAAYVTLAHLALVRKDFKEAERLLKLAERVDGEHPHVYIIDAMLSEAKGNPDDALKLLIRAVELAPNDALALGTLGLALQKRGQFAFAEKTLQNALNMRPEAHQLRAVRVQLLRRLNRLDEAVDECEELVRRVPNNLAARHKQAELILLAGRHQDAIKACRVILDREPRFIPALQLALDIYQLVGQPADGIALIEQLLETSPHIERLWEIRLRFTSNDIDRERVLDRWELACQGSARWLEARAIWIEAQGRLDEAEAYADSAIEHEVGRVQAQYIKLRAELRRAPEKALARIDMLQQAAATPAALRQVLAWRGLINDRSGNYSQAATNWLEMSPLAAVGLPLPRAVPANEARRVRASKARSQLLWGLPGSRVERIAAMINDTPERHVLVDRIGMPGRNDGFGALRARPDTVGAGIAKRWRDGLASFRLPEENLVDWLPHWDGWTGRMLADVALIVALRDPRDLFLNWLSYGSICGYIFPGQELAAQWLAQVISQLLQARESSQQQIYLLSTDSFDNDAGVLVEQLRRLLNSEAAPDLQRATAMGQGRGLMPADLPGGHWRHYQQSFTTAFDILAPVAEQLGYPYD